MKEQRMWMNHCSCEGEWVSCTWRLADCCVQMSDCIRFVETRTPTHPHTIFISLKALVKHFNRNTLFSAIHIHSVIWYIVNFFMPCLHVQMSEFALAALAVYDREGKLKLSGTLRTRKLRTEKKKTKQTKDLLKKTGWNKFVSSINSDLLFLKVVHVTLNAWQMNNLTKFI